LFLIIWSPAIVKFRTQHTREQARSLTEGDRARLLVQEIVNLENIANLDRNGLVSILSRVDQVQNAGVLAEYCSANQRFAGFSPYVGALLGFVPRLIFKDKPVPHSWNNTVAGTPWYVVGDIRNEPWNNFGLTTSGISYWQFGWWGVFGAAIANAFFMYTVLLRFVLGGIVMKALLLAYIYYSNSMFVLPPDLLAAFLTKILPYCLLLYAARHFKVFRPPLLSCGTQNKSA
jgi:hypothetical protein